MNQAQTVANGENTSSRSNPLSIGCSPDSAPQAAGEFLIFQLGNEEYGIDILHVQEIRSYHQPTLIANAPNFIKGVIDLRGVIVPILDLRLKFALKAEYLSSTVVIILGLKERIVGMIVDAVSDVLALDSQHIRPAPQLGGDADIGYVTGIGSAMLNDRERMLILVDIEQLISSDDINLNHQ